jgi:hypothetical protein
MNHRPNDYEETMIRILTKPTTNMWVFFRPTIPVVVDKTKKEEKIVGFKVIKGEFLISFR